MHIIPNTNANGNHNGARTQIHSHVIIPDNFNPMNITPMSIKNRSTIFIFVSLNY